MKRWLILLLALPAFAAQADERIVDFHSEIVVGADAGMQVTETIRVRAEGERIRHGLYRDFPTRYRDRHGNRVQVGFEVERVTRDGVAEPFHTEALGNGVRIYMGANDTSLAPGEHTYALHYRTTRQLGHFGARDELYWNVTGNGWDFAIDAASAGVTLPGAIAPAQMHVEGYTGVQGAQGQDYVAQADAPSHARFHATRALAPGEGLTIVASFPQGAVARPDAAQQTAWFLRDNAGVLVLGLGLLLVWAYYLVQWWRVGRDPRAGVIIPQYEPPPGLTPGALRRVEKMGWDDRCVAADLVDLGVRGALQIHQDGRTWRLVRTHGARAALPAAEASLLECLLGDRAELVLQQDQHATIAAGLKAHRAALEQEDAGRWFRTHRGHAAIGALLSLAALGLGVLALDESLRSGDTGGLLAWLGIWSLGVAALVAGAANAWRGVARGEGGLGGALFMTLFALPFVAAEVGALYMLAARVGGAFPLAALALLATNPLFFHLLKAPTPEGRRLLDRIAGLRLYLGVAERDELALAKAPPMTTAEFQRGLPYALALGVEKTWADRFAAAVGPAAAAAAASSMGWYHGSDLGHSAGLGSFARSLGSSFSGAIASSSSAPGSSSGSGGGGSSGGGGGGGGGGGW
jgi:uncharacterized membrane protein YgcG